MTKNTKTQEQPGHDTLRARLAAYLEQNKRVSLTAAARSMGLAGSALSRWSHGKYEGNNEKIAQAVAVFLDREDERGRILHEGGVPFITTAVSKSVFGAARKAHLTRSMGLLVGPSGVGKTRSIKEYARRYPDAILIECNVFAKAREVVTDIHRAVGGSGTGSDNQMLSDIVERLRGSGRLLIIDEAESLRARTLDGIRRIHDFAEIGVLYVGLDKFYHQLRKLNVDYEYVVNRIRTFTRLGRLDIDDTQALASTILPDAKQIAEELHDASHGVARVLLDLCREVAAMSRVNEIEINAEMVRQAAEERGV
ncbi:MAG: AAA family ATPase [Bacteroidota bacterium]|nr:AAA family ATPase [Bacteroidota bacterium]